MQQSHAQGGHTGDAAVDRPAADGEMIDGQFDDFDDPHAPDSGPEYEGTAWTSRAGPSTRTTPAAVEPATLAAGKHSF